MKRLRRLTAALVLALLVPAFTTPALAGGFLVARFGAEDANPTTDSPVALYFNPAGLALRGGTRLYAEGLFAYRVVNFPAFGDFLIATEAELNKVSWSPWSKLKQDTVVVLVTVLLLTLFLFVVDQGWAWLLTRVGVVHVPEQAETLDSTKELPW